MSAVSPIEVVALGLADAFNSVLTRSALPLVQAKAFFMTVWRPSTRSAENSCGIRQGWKCAKHSPRNGQSVSVLRQRAVRTRALSFAKQSSMGLRSGL